MKTTTHVLQASLLENFECVFLLLLDFFGFGFGFFPLCVFLGPHPMAYGDSQARGQIRAIAAGISAGSEPSLRPKAQPTATPDP